MSWEDRIKELPENVKRIIGIMLYCMLFSVTFLILKGKMNNYLAGLGALEYTVFNYWNSHMDKVDAQIKEGFLNEV